MLMDVSSTSNKSLDGFYNELRRKYPNTFTIAADLGKEDGSVQKLPRLDRTPFLGPQGIPPSPFNSGPQRWTPDSFLSKVKLQKIQNEQRQEVETFQRNGGAVIIRDKTKPVPVWNKREYLAAQNQASFRLPNLRTRVEQNKAELQTRLNTTRNVNNEIKINQSPTLNRNQKPAEVRPSNESISTGDGSVVPANVTGPKSDPLGTIMKELLPSKPGRLMTDLPKNKDILYGNGAGVSDSDSGVSVCTPMKVFRPKIRSPHDAPASSDIIKKFSAKPVAHSGPMKADHTVLPENITQIVNVGESSEKIFLKKSSINYNEKIQQRPPTARVHFEDESKQEAEVRYQERRLIERTHTAKVRSDILPKPQLKPLEKAKTLESTANSPSPSIAERSPTDGQRNANLPYRRQPFPPNVAKKVLIDIPRSGSPSRRPVQIRTSQAMKDKQYSSSTAKEASSLDGITMSLTSPNQEWKKPNPSISDSKEENKSHHSFSSLETIGSGFTEVSSEVTITTLEWRGSGSSIGSDSHTRSSSQNQDLNLNHPSMGKGTEVSFYSKVKRSLQVKMKMSSDTRMMNDTHQSEGGYSHSGSQHSKFIEMDQRSDASVKLDRREKVASHGKSSLHGATSPRQVIMRENEGSSISQDRMKMDAEAQNKDRDVPMKAPFLSMRMMQSLLKKGRAKNYVVRVPSPPPPESRPTSGRPAIPAPRVNRLKKEHVTERGSARVLAVQSDSSRLVELQRPKTGFSGLYLTKRIQNHHTGLYVVQLSGAFTSTFPQGILAVGDEILEINRRQAKDLSMEEIQSLLEESSCVLLRVLPSAHGL